MSTARGSYGTGTYGGLHETYGTPSGITGIVAGSTSAAIASGAQTGTPTSSGQTTAQVTPRQ